MKKTLDLVAYCGALELAAWIPSPSDNQHLGGREELEPSRGDVFSCEIGVCSGPLVFLANLFPQILHLTTVSANY